MPLNPLYNYTIHTNGEITQQGSKMRGLDVSGALESRIHAQGRQSFAPNTVVTMWQDGFTIPKNLDRTYVRMYCTNPKFKDDPRFRYITETIRDYEDHDQSRYAALTLHPGALLQSMSIMGNKDTSDEKNVKIPYIRFSTSMTASPVVQHILQTELTKSQIKNGNTRQSVQMRNFLRDMDNDFLMKSTKSGDITTLVKKSEPRGPEPNWSLWTNTNKQTHAKPSAMWGDTNTAQTQKKDARVAKPQPDADGWTPVVSKKQARGKAQTGPDDNGKSADPSLWSAKMEDSLEDGPVLPQAKLHSRPYKTYKIRPPPPEIAATLPSSTGTSLKTAQQPREAPSSVPTWSMIAMRGAKQKQAAQKTKAAPTQTDSKHAAELKPDDGSTKDIVSQSTCHSQTQRPALSDISVSTPQTGKLLEQKSNRTASSRAPRTMYISQKDNRDATSSAQGAASQNEADSTQAAIISRLKQKSLEATSRPPHTEKQLEPPTEDKLLSSEKPQLSMVSKWDGKQSTARAGLDLTDADLVESPTTESNPGSEVTNTPMSSTQPLTAATTFDLPEVRVGDKDLPDFMGPWDK